MATGSKDHDLQLGALETISEDEMERLLEARHEEIEAKLTEAREAYDRGEYVELEPLYDFLTRAHERHAVRKRRA